MNAYEFEKQYLGLQEVRDRNKIINLLRSKAQDGDISIDPVTTSWCAAWANFVERSVGNPGTGSLMALSFKNYGDEVELDEAQQGDIVVFKFPSDSPGHGHVTFFVSKNYDNGTVLCLGGNQHNMLDYANYIQDYIVTVRRYNK